MSQVTVQRSCCGHRFFFLPLNKCSLCGKEARKAGNIAAQGNLELQKQVLPRGIHVQVDTNYQDEFFTGFACFCLSSAGLGNEGAPPRSALKFILFF